MASTPSPRGFKIGSFLRIVAVLVLGAVLGAVLLLRYMTRTERQLSMDFDGMAVASAAGVPSFAMGNAIAPAPSMQPQDIGMGDKSVFTEGYAEQTAAGAVGGDRVIKTADLSLQVEDAPTAMEKAKAFAAQVNGFVLQATISGTEKGDRTAWVSVHVPVSRFEESVMELKKIGTLLLSESVNGQDVTEEYADLESQVRNARVEEAQYQEIMKRAGDIEDVLAVAKQLADVRGRIERLEGRRQFLANRTDYSMITVRMSEEPVVYLPSASWRPMQIVQQTLRFLVETFQTLVNVVIIVVIVGVGLLVPLALVFWLLIALGRRLLQRFLK
ncbi:DUF4349 domain-containing protein [Patescibacteria group bacterium]|nr:DUF4349 domain-containing protein [Patescibacteria group bacterium]